jgi:hypothetical protein
MRATKRRLLISAMLSRSSQDLALPERERESEKERNRECERGSNRVSESNREGETERERN